MEIDPATQVIKKESKCTECAIMNGSMQPFFITSICIGERLFTAIHCGGVCIWVLDFFQFIFVAKKDKTAKPRVKLKSTNACFDWFKQTITFSQMLLLICS